MHLIGDFNDCAGDFWDEVLSIIFTTANSKRSSHGGTQKAGASTPVASPNFSKPIFNHLITIAFGSDNHPAQSDNHKNSFFFRERFSSSGNA
jgi:hypothetical protein